MTAGPRSLRVRVTAVASLAVLVVLSVASVGLVVAQRAALVDALDESLDQLADEITARVRAGQPPTERDLAKEDVVVQVVGADGTVLAASPGLAGDLPRDTGSSPTTVSLPGTSEEARLVTGDADATTVLVAGSLEDVRDSTRTLAGSLLLAVPLSTAVLAGVVWWAVGRALRPVEDIRTRVDEISAARLDRRVPESETADEIARLARTMNAMLGRLQDAADQQRAFVADASHELRSPLARMRMELEVDAAHPETADGAATAASVLAETVALQQLVDDLLLLARGDAGALDVVDHRPVDLDEVVRTQGAGVPRVDVGGVRPVQVPGDPGQLQRAVANLLDNAVQHAREHIVVTLREEPDGWAELVVADDGPGVSPADRDRVFERFTRLDDARSVRDGGAGLGLAIARDIAERHGGTLTVASDPASDGPPGARFVLRLPAWPDERTGGAPPTVRR
jgi:signal transduction histidine kinase